MATLLRRARYLLDGLGLLFLVCVAWIGLVIAWEWVADLRYAGLAGEQKPPSATAQKIARAITPRLQEAARDYQPLFLQHAAARGVIARVAAGKVYPAIVAEIPKGTAIGVNDLLSYFGHYSVSDLAELLVKHAEETGDTVHPSLHQAAANASLTRPSETWRFP